MAQFNNQLFANNATSRTQSGILIGDGVLTLENTTGNWFPAIDTSKSEFFLITVEDAEKLEIMRVTDRNDDTLTVVRAQEGTAEANFDRGALVQLRLTAGTIESFFAANRLANLYLGPQSVPPTTALSGGPLTEGMFYYNTTDGVTYVYDEVLGWKPMFQAILTPAAIVSFTYLAGANQTVFSGADLNGNTFDKSLYPDNPVIVLLNGVEQIETKAAYTTAGLVGDYVLDEGASSVTFAQGVNATSVVVIKILVEVP